METPKQTAQSKATIALGLSLSNEIIEMCNKYYFKQCGINDPLMRNIETKMTEYIENFGNIYTEFPVDCICGCCKMTSLAKKFCNVDVLSINILNTFKKHEWLKSTDMVFLDQLTEHILSLGKFCNVCELIVNFFDPESVVKFSDSYGQTILDVLFNSHGEYHIYSLVDVIDFLETHHFDFHYVGNPRLTYIHAAINVYNSYLIKRFVELGVDIYENGSETGETRSMGHQICSVFCFCFDNNLGREHNKSYLISCCQMIQFCITEHYFDKNMTNETGNTLRFYVEKYKKQGMELLGSTYCQFTDNF